MNVVTVTYDLSAKSWSDAIPTQLDSERTLVLVFGPADLLDAKGVPIAEIVGAFPKSQVIGCSTSGVVSGGALRDGVVSVTVTQFDKTTMSSAMAQHSEAFTVGQMIGKKLSKPSLRAVLVFADGVEVSGAELVRGLNSTLDQSMVVVGGMAGDGGNFQRSWVLGGGGLRKGVAAAVGLYGEHIVVGHATRSGWTKLGEELTVTKSDGRVIYELDGRPALTVYEERIALAGPGQISLPLALPLGVRASARHDKSLVRTVLAVDAAKQTLTLAVDVPQGYLVQPLQASATTLVEAAREAAASLPASAPPVGADALVLTVSHASRRLVLTEGGPNEIASATGALTGPKAHVTGIYGFGEIAPSAQGHSDLNNQSFTVASFMESEAPIARKGSRGLAVGAARAQAPTTAAGPAAHLRSRHQTVDDLFAAIELEGGERRPNASPTAGAKPVPPPIRRVSTGAMRAPPLPTRDSSGALPASSPVAAAARPSAPQQIPTPSVGTAAATLAKPTGPLLQTSAPISGTRRPSTLPSEDDFEDEKTLSGGKYTMAISAFGYEGGLGRWSIDPLPTAPDSPQTLVLAFGGGPNHASAIDALTNAYPQSHILGCSAPVLRRAGATATLTVNTVRFTHTKIGTAWTDLAIGAAQAGQALGQKLMRPDLRAVFLVGDGEGVDKEAFLQALVGVCPSNVTIAGGFTAGEKGSLVLCNSLHRKGIAAAVGFYGEHLLVANSVQSGFEAFGPERTVTKAAGNVVYELDGRPALSVYAEYMRDPIAANAALGFPLGIKRGDIFTPRLPISFDATARSITFAGEVPVDAVVRLMRGNHDRLLADVDTATKAAALGAGTGDGLVIAVSSSGRSNALGDRAEEEVEVIRDSLPANVAPYITGFYSVAEIGANGKTGRADLLNESISLTVFTESPLPVGERTEHVVLTTRQTMPAPPLAHPAVTPSPAQVTRRSTPAGRTASLPAPSSGKPRSALTQDSVGTSSSGSRRVDVVRPSMSAAGGTNTAKVTKRQYGDITVVTFAGRLSESFKGDAQGRELSGTVVLDLAGVERITSFGVREWLQMLNVANDRVKKLYFAHCSEAVVNQLTMIRKFAGNAQVVSFFAPYLCDSCGEQFERRFDCEYDADAIRAGDVPESICQQCSGRGRFDDDPETYFAFTPQHLGQPIPQGVRDVLNELDAMTQQGSGEATEKIIEGDLTRVRVKSKAGAGLRWQRILDGIEGTVVIDLGGLGSLDNAGLANFEQALSALGAEVESVRLDRAPQAVVERFAVQGLPRRVVVASAVLTAFCPACNVQRPALVVVEEHAHAFASGRGPTLSCKRCNSALSLVDTTNIPAFLARQRRRPSMQPRAVSTPPAPLVSTPPALRPAPVFSAFPGPAQVPVAESMQGEAAAGSGRGIIIGAIILAVAILGSAAVFARSRRAATDETTSEVKPAASAAPKLGDIPPGWVERPFVEEGGMLLIVGRCERAPSAEQALTQARNDAINRIVQQLYTDLTASSSDEYLAVQSKLETTGPRASLIAEKYLRQTGALSLPERGETIVRQKDGGVEAFARYRLSRAVYTQVRSLYSTTASFQGATIARIFPLLDVGKEDAELVVTSVGKTSRLADSLHVGDFLLRFNGKPVASVEALNKAMDEWNQAAPGVTFELQIRSNGAPDTVKIKKQSVPVTPVYRPIAPAPAPRPAPGSTKDLGIILPPRTF